MASPKDENASLAQCGCSQKKTLPYDAIHAGAGCHVAIASYMLGAPDTQAFFAMVKGTCAPPPKLPCDFTGMPPADAVGAKPFGDINPLTTAVIDSSTPPSFFKAFARLGFSQFNDSYLSKTLDVNMVHMLRAHWHMCIIVCVHVFVHPHTVSRHQPKAHTHTCILAKTDACIRSSTHACTCT